MQIDLIHLNKFGENRTYSFLEILKYKGVFQNILHPSEYVFVFKSESDNEPVAIGIEDGEFFHCKPDNTWAFCSFRKLAPNEVLQFALRNN